MYDSIASQFAMIEVATYLQKKTLDHYFFKKCFKIKIENIFFIFSKNQIHRLPRNWYNKVAYLTLV